MYWGGEGQGWEGKGGEGRGGVDWRGVRREQKRRGVKGRGGEIAISPYSSPEYLMAGEENEPLLQLCAM